MVHRCVVNSVVMLLHILVGPGFCVYVALLGRWCDNTETRQSYLM